MNPREKEIKEEPKPLTPPTPDKQSLREMILRRNNELKQRKNEEDEKQRDAQAKEAMQRPQR